MELKIDKEFEEFKEFCNIIKATEDMRRGYRMEELAIEVEKFRLARTYLPLILKGQPDPVEIGFICELSEIIIKEIIEEYPEFEEKIRKIRENNENNEPHRKMRRKNGR